MSFSVKSVNPYMKQYGFFSDKSYFDSKLNPNSALSGSTLFSSSTVSTSPIGLDSKSNSHINNTKSGSGFAIKLNPYAQADSY